METVDNRTFKEKAKDFVGRAKLKVNDGWEFIKKHPVEAATITTTTAAGLRTIYKIFKYSADRRDDRERAKTVYCNDIQTTVKLKHTLNYFEARELRDRMDSGQTKFEALDEMGLLKK